MLQAEFSLTQVLDKPVSGRIFFEQVIRDNLDIGRPDQVGLIFGRRIIRRPQAPTPGRFRTRVITEGVTPSLHVDYKNSKIKQYHKLGKAIRTETTINDTRDFGIGKRLTNLPALRQIGFTANRRLLGVQILSHDPIAGAAALAQVTDPVTTPAGTRVAGLRLTDQRSLALLPSCASSGCCPHGFTNADLRHHLAPLLGKTPELMTSGQITYDLRRLRLHGLIERIPHTFRYQVTDTGCARARSSPASTTGSCAPAWPSSPTPTRPHQPRCAPPTAPTKPPSTTSPAKPGSPPDHPAVDPISPDLTQNSWATPPKPSSSLGRPIRACRRPDTGPRPLVPEPGLAGR